MVNKIISLSVWGNNPRYIVGANRQYELAKKYYPGWEFRIYTDDKNKFSNLTDANIIEGDIYISIERVKDNAIQFKKENIEELIRVICHGVLHLVGYKDKSTNDIKVMREKEGYYIGVFKKQMFLVEQ